jgi:hypothetical protein
VADRSKLRVFAVGRVPSKAAAFST